MHGVAQTCVDLLALFFPEEAPEAEVFAVVRQQAVPAFADPRRGAPDDFGFAESQAGVVDDAKAEAA